MSNYQDIPQSSGLYTRGGIILFTSPKISSEIVQKLQLLKLNEIEHLSSQEDKTKYNEIKVGAFLKHNFSRGIDTITMIKYITPEGKICIEKLSERLTPENKVLIKSQYANDSMLFFFFQNLENDCVRNGKKSKDISFDCILSVKPVNNKNIIKQKKHFFNYFVGSRKTRENTIYETCIREASDKGNIVFDESILSFEYQKKVRENSGQPHIPLYLDLVYKRDGDSPNSKVAFYTRVLIIFVDENVNFCENNGKILLKENTTSSTSINVSPIFNESVNLINLMDSNKNIGAPLLNIGEITYNVGDDICIEESDTVEFKESFSFLKGQDGIEKYFSSFGNTKGGSLYVGVSDIGKIVGVKVKDTTSWDKIQRDILSNQSSISDPEFLSKINVSRIPLKKADMYVIKIEIPKNDKTESLMVKDKNNVWNSWIRSLTCSIKNDRTILHTSTEYLKVENQLTVANSQLEKLQGKYDNLIKIQKGYEINLLKYSTEIEKIQKVQEGYETKMSEYSSEIKKLNQSQKVYENKLNNYIIEINKFKLNHENSTSKLNDYIIEIEDIKENNNVQQSYFQNVIRKYHSLRFPMKRRNYLFYPIFALIFFYFLIHKIY